MAEKSNGKQSREKSGSTVSETILEAQDETESYTNSDDVPDIDLDNPINFESRQPYKAPGTPTINSELQKETLDLVMSTLNESSKIAELNNNESKG